jgi:hypothetical protein
LNITQEVILPTVRKDYVTNGGEIGLKFSTQMDFEDSFMDTLNNQRE